MESSPSPEADLLVGLESPLRGCPRGPRSKGRRHGGDEVRDEYWDYAIFQELSSNPATIESAKAVKRKTKTFSTTDEKIRQTVKRRKGVDDEGDEGREAAAPAALAEAELDEGYAMIIKGFAGMEV